MSDETILAQMPIDRQICFSNEKGEPSDKVKARQSKWLLKLWPLLKDKLAKDERILFMARADDEDGPERGVQTPAYLLMFTTARILRLPMMLVAGEMKSAINRILNNFFEPKGWDHIDVETLGYGDIRCFEVWSTLYGYLALRLVNGERDLYVFKDWGDQYKIRSFLHHYMSEFQTK